jgi:protein TonB
MDNQRYFYISGIISFALFLLFLGMFIIMLFQVENIKKYGFQKKEFISVSIEIPLKKESYPHKKSSVPAVSQVKSEKSHAKNIDVQNLFSDVWTQKLEDKKEVKKINSKRLSEIQKQIKFKNIKTPLPTDKKLEKRENNSENKESASNSSANEVNEYLAKIQAIVYQHFNVPPNTEGNSVKTVIELDPYGKMLDFRVLNYSGNSDLDNEVDKIKERLKNVIFPQNPEHKSSRTTVILISKE